MERRVLCGLLTFCLMLTLDVSSIAEIIEFMEPTDPPGELRIEEEWNEPEIFGEALDEAALEVYNPSMDESGMLLEEITLDDLDIGEGMGEQAELNGTQDGAISAFSNGAPDEAPSWNGHAYNVYSIDSIRSWQDAKSYCEQQGGYLATITSEEENTFVYQEVLMKSEYTSAYFGLTDEREEGVWEWVTGEPVEYLNWSWGEPNDEYGYEDYAMFYWEYTNGTWNDGSFSDATGNAGFNFICEWGDYSIPPSEEYAIGDEKFDVTLEQCLEGKNSTKYHTDLAYMLMALANAAYDQGSISAAFSNLGFGDYQIYSYYSDPDDSRYGEDNVAFTIGSKQVNGEQPVVLIVVRGSYGEIKQWTSDWRSNSKIKTDSKNRHLGFGHATDKVYVQLKKFLKAKGYSKSKVRYVITGHSRGAAVANLLTVKLLDEGISKKKVFDYNFACPDTARELKIKDWQKGCENIFNVCNSADVVSVIPGVVGDTVASGLGYSGVEYVQARARSLFEAWGKYGNTLFYCKDWNSADEFDLTRIFSDDSPHDQANYVDYMKLGKDTFYTWTDIVKRRAALYIDVGVERIVNLFYLDYAVDRAELSKQGANGTLYVYKGKEVKLIPSFARKIAYSSSRGSAAGRRKKQQIKSYTTSKKSVATVSPNGLVTAKKVGETKITAVTRGGHKANVTVKVVVPPSKVKLNKSGTVKMKAGKTLQLKAALSPTGAYTTITWTSSNESVAKVSGKGKVTAVGAGKATIKATTHNGKTASCKVKVSGQTVKVGQTVTFGLYEQDNDAANGAEPIEWIVLANDGESCTLISKYGLDAVSYNREWTSVTWETCTLRKWLNGEFLNTAFTPKEQMKLGTVTVTGDANPEYSTDPGNDTQDKVFLLSINEANKLFSSDDSRICNATKYAVAQGAWTNDSGACWWWLRSPGSNTYDAADVSHDGSVGGSSSVNNVSGAVRPVVCLRLSQPNQ